MARHGALTDVHLGAYVGPGDPSLDVDNEVLADKLWVDTSGIEPYPLKLRNLANDGWLEVGATSSGGTTLTVNRALAGQGATFSASAVADGGGVSNYDADQAFDSNDASHWSTPMPAAGVHGAAGAWVRTDLGVVREIRQIRASQYPSVAMSASHAVDWSLEYSDDDATWITALVFAAEQDTGIVTLEAPISARYWRLLGVAQLEPDHPWGIQTLALYTGGALPEGSGGHIIRDAVAAFPGRGSLAFAGAVVTDDEPGDITLVTIQSGHIIEDSLAAFPHRSRLVLHGVTVVDDEFNDKTDVTVPSGGGGLVGAGYMKAFTDPTTPSWAAFNSPGSSGVVGEARTVSGIAANEPDIRGRRYSTAGIPWRIEAGIVTSFPLLGAPGAGIAVFDSTTGNYLGVEYGWDATDDWTVRVLTGAISATPTELAEMRVPPGPVWFRFDLTLTTLTIWWSADGRAWVQLYTEAAGTTLTNPGQVGHYLRPRAATGAHNLSMSLFSWSEGVPP